MWTEQKKWCKIRKERGFAMFGFLTVGTTLTMLDLALKNEIESQKDETFPRDLEGTKGMIRLHKNHNQGFSFGVLEGSRAVELIPLCMTSGLAGAWVFLMGTKGRILEKLAVTLSLAGGLSNLIDRMKRGYVVDYFSVQWKTLKKVVFNLGDIFIFCGSALLLAAGLIDTLKDNWRNTK